MLNNQIHFTYQVPGDDFTRAGEASSNFKDKLKKMGVDPTIVRKAAIAMYEGEINMVIHARGGSISVSMDPEAITMTLEDVGPGIADIPQAMKEGYSTAPDNVRALGFGAGMGLPNMKKYTDEMEVTSVVGKGTTVHMKVHL